MSSLDELRNQIDELDRQIIRLLGQRAETVHQVAELKHSDADIVASDRQAEVYRTRRAWAQEQSLDPEFVESLYRAMIAHFIEVERELLRRRSDDSA